MKAFLVFSVVYFLSCVGGSEKKQTRYRLNDRPIIGVLSQEQAYSMRGKYEKENFTSYIAASYVKAIEAAGARVVPIMIGKDRNYYKDIMSKINGVLFPGGATYFNQSNGYADAGQHIYEIAKEMTDLGNYFPVFGTCLGFELIVILASGRDRPENRVECRSFDNLRLVFKRGFRRSKMFKNISDDILYVLQTENVTANAHSFCVLDKNMRDYNLTKDWRIMSYSFDENGLKFISSIEHKRYPIYGVQFHPEKSAYEWNKSSYFNHSLKAIQANRYFMDFFVAECRKNKNSFVDEKDENKYLIYNYKPYFTAANGGYFTQSYFFEPKGIVENR